MRRFIGLVTLVLITLVAVIPLIATRSSYWSQWIGPNAVVYLNLLGWFLVLAFLFARFDLGRYIFRLASDLGLDNRFKSIESVLSVVIHEINRKNRALSLKLVEGRIKSKEELSRALETIVGSAFQLLDCESAELALFDRESGMYHSSFVLGKPFRSSAQAMLSGAVEGQEREVSPDVLVQPIAFAGSVLGSLRVALKKGRLPSMSDREIMRLLALQGGLALINADYTHELVKMKQLSEESVKAKTGFLANLSHELRGPLGIIMNAVELVIDGLCGPVNEDQLETLQMVRSNGEHLLELVNDVLDYAKIEAGKIVPEKVDILVNDLLKDLTNVVRSQADAKSHKIKFTAAEEALAISCDRRQIRQMLINVLTNAIKYTEEGGQIEVWAERIPGHKIKINVKDNGVGIHHAEQHKVFSAFERVEHTYSIKQVGSGLGMPLTKRLCEMNGGLIDFQSTAGQGSHFWIVFPAIKFTASSLHEEDDEEVEVQGNGEVVLLVEKNEGERKILARYLSHLGFKVADVSSKLEALDALRQEKVDITILDNDIIDDPEEDIIKSIRDKANSKSLPIILISSRAFVFDIEKYLKAGIDRCLIKPIQLKEVAVTSRELLDGTFQGSVIDETELELNKREAHKEQEVAMHLDEIDDIFH